MRYCGHMDPDYKRVLNALALKLVEQTFKKDIGIQRVLARQIKHVTE